MTDNLTIDPKVRKALTDAYNEWVKSEVNIESEKSVQKDIVEAASEVSGIDKPTLNRMFKMHRNSDKNEQEKKFEGIINAYEMVFQSANTVAPS